MPDAERHEPPSDLRCSARGCHRPAAHALRWNNPRLHTPERRKTWLACEDHRQSLSDHLAVRSFLREVEPVTGLVPVGLPAAHLHDPVLAAPRVAS